jgi:hypothetical protein
MSDTHSTPGDRDSRPPAHDPRAEDPRIEDPAVDAPWKDLGPREDLDEGEVAERASRPDPHSGS